MTTVEPIRNKSDIKKVEKVLAKQSQRDLMLFVLVLGTNCGLRISDLLSLNVGDVRNKTHIQIIEKKTGKFKKFPINDRLKPMIEDFVKGRRNAEPLFLSHWKHRLDRVTAYYLIRDACEKAGLQERIGTAKKPDFKKESVRIQCEKLSATTITNNLRTWLSCKKYSITQVPR